MSKIFISYRRDDTENYVGRIYDRLCHDFGEDNVFLDTEKIIDGTHFPKRLTRAVTNCDVVLVVIGKEWVSLVNRAGERRIHAPEDWVRYEVQLGLNLEKQLIPILINDASFPTKKDLPESIQELADIDGRVIRTNKDFHADMDELIEDIKAKPILDVAKRDGSHKNYSIFIWFALATVLLSGGAIGFWYFANQSEEQNNIATPTPYFARVGLGEPINVRAEPNIDAPIIATSVYPTQLTVIGQNEDGIWVNVILPDDVQGWTFASFIVDSITAAGDFQNELGCDGDWMPECTITPFTDDDGDGVYVWITTLIPIGDWEVKIAIDGTWDENYGFRGELNGTNIRFEVTQEHQEVIFNYNSRTHILTVETE
jgi:hypothetical protein